METTNSPSQEYQESTACRWDPLGADSRLVSHPMIGYDKGIFRNKTGYQENRYDYRRKLISPLQGVFMFFQLDAGQAATFLAKRLPVNDGYEWGNDPAQMEYLS